MLVDNEDNTCNHVKDYRMDLVLKKDNNFIIIEMNNEYSISSEIKEDNIYIGKQVMALIKEKNFKVLLM